MRSVEEEELMVEIRRWYEELKEGIREQGKREGWLEGRRKARIATHALLFTKRIGRPLPGAEHAVLVERLDRLGEDRLLDHFLHFLGQDGDALAAWLAAPAAC